jgi:hypothetical protein
MYVWVLVHMLETTWYNKECDMQRERERRSSAQEGDVLAG